ncbi:MAG: DNA polymerase I [Clostridia bacterium]|nr:DNA polymerase I [Clostridia bacterium]
MISDKKKLLIIDGNSIVNRAYYGVRPLSTKAGIPTNAIYGFMNIMLKYLDEYNPEYLCVAFDLKAPTFRHKMYDLYKAQRKGMPDDLAAQMPHLKELLHSMNIMQLSLEGYEADDIIGTVSRICDENGVWCGIITGDKDDLQLASDNTNVLLTTTRMGQTDTVIFDWDKVIEKYGVTPKEFISVKALMGDSSDNIPGVKGIGEKTAFDLLGKFHSLDNLYENIESDEIKKSAREKLIDGKDDAFLCYKLCEIDKNVPIEFKIEDAALKEYNLSALSDKLEELELKKIATRLGAEPVEKQAVYKEAENADENIIKSFSADELYFLPDGDYVTFLCGENAYKANITDLKHLFEDEKIKKITHKYKDMCHKLSSLSIEMKGEFYDTEIAAYIIDPTKTDYNIEEMFTELSLCVSAQSLPKLVENQLEIISSRNQSELLYDIELPLLKVLYEMECFGFRIDKDELSSFSVTLGERIKSLEESIYFMAGEEFNINSTKQLGKLLFEDMGLPVVKKTKTGYSTDSAVLEKLRGKHEIIDCIIEYRHLAKLKSTYTDAFLPLLDSENRIHSTLKQTVTQTGRISSAEPNLQNIPVRTDIGRELRKMFVAKDGCVLVGADYSQIELRVLSHMSGDETMCDAFINDKDIHTITASQVFNVPDFLVTDDMRSRAKTVNFGIIYGQSEFSLAGELKITRKEAAAYINGYFEKYSGVKEYMDKTIENAKKDGFVTTLFNRRRYIPELSAKNFNLRSFGERAAMNTPIQGSAADIIKMAMVKVHDALKKECPSARLILQIHDELIVEVPEADSNLAAEVLKREMENAAKLSVPLIADVKIGKSWYETK